MGFGFVVGREFGVVVAGRGCTVGRDFAVGMGYWVDRGFGRGFVEVGRDCFDRGCSDTDYSDTGYSGRGYSDWGSAGMGFADRGFAGTGCCRTCLVGVVGYWEADFVSWPSSS